ncbi:MAG: hypothetical protein EBS06_02075 [Proteobacteria bacterium]|nr:hypothetical protein [Pseudomonadota bacterium]
MWRKILQQIARFALIVVLLTPTILPVEASASGNYEGVRQMHWDSSEGRCVGGGYNEVTGKHTVDDLDFNPFGNNADYNFDLSNGVCAAYAATVGAIYLGFKTTSFLYCTPKNPIGAGLIPEELAAERAGSSYAWLTPMTVINYAFRGSQCGKRTSEYALLSAAGGPGSPGAVLAASDMSSCCISFAAYGAAITSAVTALAIIYGVANGAYRKARICGHDWQSWQQDENGIWKRGAYDGSVKKSIQDKYVAGLITPDLTNKEYREYIFGGEEFEDKGEGSCSSPSWGDDKKIKTLGYSSDRLRYYMTGPNSAPVFACYRFLVAKGTAAEIAAGQAAYDCCTKRSQNTVCIENAPNIAGPESNNYKYIFCEVGSRCNVNGVWFDAYVSQKRSNYACARTYSGCPYNHPLGGGTEIASYDNADDLSSIQNYCQYMNHCSILPIKPYVSRSSLTGAFFDSSCRDMKGDSQNVYGYSSNLTPVDIRGFSAPMAQCFKETMENIFFNQAGSTVCLNSDETPDSSGTCTSGYKYKKGENLSSYQKSIGQSGNSFFVRIQQSLQNTIRMALSLAIMFFGMSILIGGNAISKKQIIPFVVKIAFVMFFATGNEWQSVLLDGIIGSSAELSDIMFRTDSITGVNPDGSVNTTVAESKLDGCQFPRFNYADSNDTTKYSNPAYPPGKEYLKIWDTLDCKIARALGYGIEVSVPNLVMMILGGFITGGAGVIFLVATFAFAFFLIALTIRALHIFILSMMSIIILFYISPITVTMIMFNKTKGIFDKWWKNILSFALQPMILFAYLGILLTFFDTIVMGDVTFLGDGKSVPKKVVCSGDAVNTSIYCIFNPPISGTSGGVATYNSLKMLGIGLPILTSMNQTKISALIKAAILFFVFMSFMDKISDFAKTLTGGDAALKSNTMTTSQMLGKAQSALSGIQKRGMGAIRKNIAPKIMGAGGAVRSGIAYLGNQGKEADGPKSDSGSNAAGSSTQNSSGQNNT